MTMYIIGALVLLVLGAYVYNEIQSESRLKPNWEAFANKHKLSFEALGERFTVKGYYNGHALHLFTWTELKRWGTTARVLVRAPLPDDMRITREDALQKFISPDLQLHDPTLDNALRFEGADRARLAALLDTPVTRAALHTMVKLGVSFELRGQLLEYTASGHLPIEQLLPHLDAMCQLADALNEAAGA
jgi:hypothetical protein